MEIYAFSNERTQDALIRIASSPLNFLVGSRAIQPSDIMFAKVTEIISGSNDEEAKAIQVSRNTDNSTENYTNGMLWDSDADQSIVYNEVNLICYPGYKFKVNQIIEVAYIPFADEAKWIGFPPSESGLTAFQITDVNYSANNGKEPSPTYIYKGTLVDTIDAAKIVTPVLEEDKFNIKIINGFPWNLRVGDNLIKLGQSADASVYYANNDICPDPVIKIQSSGQVHVFSSEKEDTPISLKTLIASEYFIMSQPSSVDLTKYDNIFPIAQWSKKDQKVRIYLPVI